MARKMMTAACAAIAALTVSAPALAQQSFLGEVLLVGSNFCPAGTMDADGRLLPIQQYSALFSLYGTTYGGDGATSFAIPKLTPPLAGMHYCVVVDGAYPPRPNRTRTN
ncbi:phage tail protein [Sphingosinithalassobacter sp. CS137]|uniref:phage tail protein n=1 Tax=Sphingosinithalassobacter sp. CS137 TaxID=2762748 RepID=UPI00165E0969|nr:phage tail protein [Sphingosinithalassobacter sp. CS137]